MNNLRRTLAASLLSAIAICPALGGDLAERDILGFSDDGRLFAFEEHGVFDGSGYPYSNIFVVDTRTDKWVAGTPVRMSIDVEQASVETARTAAAKAAAPFLKGIRPRGLVAASNPPTETSADPHLVRFRNNPAVPPYETGLGSEYELQLDELGFGENRYVDGDLKGFRLRLRPMASDGQPAASASRGEVTLHEDKSLPQPRERAFAYRITDVLLYRQTLVVLIMVASHGFETPDGRYLAVARTCEASTESKLECTQ